MLCFGDFSFDPATGELTRGTVVERLAPQTAQVLRLLIERPGEVISREEFRHRLWPDTTVEFDQGLNFCIRQLRIALDDDAVSPRYIETLPRRGYRFRAAVIAREQTLALPHGTARVESRHPRRSWTIAAIAIAVVTGGVIAWASHRASTAAPILAIVPFDVDTSVPVLRNYRDALAESMVERATNRAGRAVVIIGPGMTRRFESRTPIDTIRARLGAGYALSGVVRRRADAFDIFAQLVRANDRGHIWAIRLLDSTSVGDYASVGTRIADSVAAILLAARARRPLGVEDNVTQPRHPH